MREVRELRDAVFALLLAATRGEPAPAGVERRLNAVLAAVPLVPQLRDGVVELVATAPADPVDELLARAAASAFELLASPRARLLRRAELRAVLHAQPARPALVRHGVRHADPRGAAR